MRHCRRSLLDVQVTLEVSRYVLALARGLPVVHGPRQFLALLVLFVPRPESDSESECDCE